MPEEFHGQRSLGGYSQWDCKELDMTEQLTLSQEHKYWNFSGKKNSFSSGIVCVLSCSVVSDSATPWTILPMEFSRPEYWNWQPFPSPGHLPNPGIKPRSPTLWVDSLPVEPPGNPKNTRVGSLSLLRIFPTQESHWGLLHCRWILHQLSYQGSPDNLHQNMP